jgi:hypothetical protein
MTLPTTDEPFDLSELARTIYSPKDRGRKEALEKQDMISLLKSDEFNWEGATIELVKGPFFEAM